MAMSGGKDDGSPMMDLNMTPMIDVLLVLLILFIMTIPAQTHAVKVDLPVNSNQPAPPVEPQKNKIIIYADDRMTWNGTRDHERRAARAVSRGDQADRPRARTALPAVARCAVRAASIACSR